MMLVLPLLVLPGLVSGRPGGNLRITFDDHLLDSSSGLQCRVEAGEVPWLEDGGCYVLGERGPCAAGQTLQLIDGSPGCGPGEGGACHQSWQVSVEGECHDLLSRGPCKAGLWVVLHPASMTGVCEAVPCPGPEVWRSEECRCVGEEEAGQVCGQHAGLVWSPTADGVCACHDGYYADQAGVCHELNSRGPCQEGQFWLLDHSQDSAYCGQDTVRLFEQISSKSNRGSSGTAQALGCFVDENGRCRKTLNIRGRFRDEEGAEGFLDWLGGFPERGSDCWPVRSCEEEVGEGVVWSDGECYQLASTGPCQAGHWLVLETSHTSHSLSCQQRDCPSQEVWWSPSCSCFPLNQTSRLKSDLESPCRPDERLLVSPYGDGVCAVTEDSVRIFEYLSSSGSQSSSAATRKNCFMDENGRCRKTLNIRGRIKAEDNGTDDAFQDLLTWLDQFPKPSTDCDVVDSEEVTARELDCHREGKILFEDGHCYNLLERGPCFEDSMWLVMVVQPEGGLEAECRPRRCVSNDTIWEPESCECYSSRDPRGPCGEGERLYEDIYGLGVCGCVEGHEVWPSTGECHRLGGRGPCQEGETFSYDVQTLLATCTDTPGTRVFDLIPPGPNNINNTNKVTKETCVLDARGKCRRKITIKRAGSDEDNQAEEFRSWLESFIVRSPQTFQCTGN